MISINTDTTSLMLLNNINRVSSLQSKLMEKLSTGLKVNHASDDPAGLYIATGLYSQIRSNIQISKDIQLTNNVLLTADNALGTVNTALNRVHDLTLQAANGIYSDEARAAMQNEVNQLYEQIHQTIGNTTFNGKQLLMETSNPESVSPIQIYVSTGEKSSSTISYNPALAEFTGIDISTPEAAAEALKTLEAQQNAAINKQTEIGIQSNILGGIYESLQVKRENLEASYSTVMDTDYASVISELNKNSVLQAVLTNMFSIQISSAKALLSLVYPISNK